MASSYGVYATRNTWNFPRHVAKEEGYFGEEGLDVQLVERKVSHTEYEDFTKRKNLQLFNEGEADIYSACVWGTIKRTWNNSDGCLFAHDSVASNLPYKIYTTPESDIETVEDLADVPVAIKIHSGSHYGTIEELEQHLDPDDVEIKHLGRPIKRIKAMLEGDIKAACLMRDTIPEEVGFQQIPGTEFTHGGAFVGPRDMQEEKMDAFIMAINRAIDDINANPERFREFFVAMNERDLSEHPNVAAQVGQEAIKENVVVPYYNRKVRRVEQGDVEEKLTWLQDHGIVSSKASIDQLLGNL